MARKYRGKLGVFTLATAALSFADKPIQKQALQFRTGHTNALKESKFISNPGGVYEFYSLAVIST
ncbi:hypothetical protein [Ferruginibacter profundus]